MGYRRALLVRWSRRDRLTVVVVAVTAAFLIGTTLLLFTAAGYSETFAQSLDNAGTVTYEDEAPEAVVATDRTVVLPVARATTGGEDVLVVGVPADAPRVVQNSSVSWQQGRLPTIPGGVDARGPVEGSRELTLNGTAGRLALSVVPNDRSTDFLARNWYVANASTVERLGATGQFTIERGADRQGLAGIPAAGVPLVSALLFVLAGLDQILRALSVAVAGGGLLVLIVVYSVTRMSVVDRLDAIRVARSTGATGRTIALLFVARAGLLALVGTALGYAVGLVTIKLIVNAAVYLGLPIALDVAVTGESLPAVVGVAGALVGVGLVAGGLAAYPAASRPPARLGRSGDTRDRRPGGRDRETGIRGRLREALSPTLVSWRSVAPTASALAVFALTFLLVFSVAGVTSSLGGDAAGGTITEAGSAHPLNSRLDADYAETIRAGGTPASAEVIYAQVRDGQPYMVHGARYGPFANVTGARLVEGRPPDGPDEAVIGTDLARTLDVTVGDRVTMGGSVSPGIRRLEVVGAYEASGTVDDLLIAPLGSVWGLATRSGTVHMIRVAGEVGPADDEAGEPARDETGVAVVGITGPRRVTRGDRVNLSVSLRNFGDRRGERSVTVRYDDATASARTTVPAGRQTSANVTVRARMTGDRTARVAGTEYAHTVTVVSPDAIRIPPDLPAEAPPRSGLYVPVISEERETVSGATVTLNGISLETGSEGAVLMPVPAEAGNYTVRAEYRNRTATRPLRVVSGAERRLTGRLSISPQSGNVLTNPTLTVYLANPWQEDLTRRVTVTGPGTDRARLVTVGAGNVTRTRYEAGGDARSQPGQYTFRLAANGTELATADYRVAGDERLAAAVASSGSFAGGTTVERSVEGVFGNVRLLFVALVVLAALSTVGATAATFAQAVHARRRTIGVHRSTGATRSRVLRTVLGDVIRVAVPATVLGVGVAAACTAVLGRLGLLVIFGFALPGVAPPAVLAAIAAGGVTLAVLGALVATVPYLLASPVSLLSGAVPGARSTGSGRSSTADGDAADPPSEDPAAGDD